MPPGRMPSNRYCPFVNGPPSSRDGSIPHCAVVETTNRRASAVNMGRTPFIALLLLPVPAGTSAPVTLGDAGLALVADAARRSRARYRRTHLG